MISQYHRLANKKKPKSRDGVAEHISTETAFPTAAYVVVNILF